VVKAWAAKALVTTPVENPTTNAPGLRVPSPFAGRQMLNVLRETEGDALAVSEAEIVEAQKLLARTEGIWTAPEAAAALAALLRLKEGGGLDRQSRIVLLLTGAGIKNPPPSLPPPLDLTGPEESLLKRVQAALAL
jgi:threonine synthase